MSVPVSDKELSAVRKSSPAIGCGAGTEVLRPKPSPENPKEPAAYEAGHPPPDACTWRAGVADVTSTAAISTVNEPVTTAMRVFI